MRFAGHYSVRIGLVAALALATTAALAGPIEGRWRLVEQRYGTGAANLIEPTDDLRLEFTRRGTGLEGRIWRGDRSDGPLPWPALVAAGNPRPVSVDRLEFAPDRGAVSATYTARPSATDDLVLEVAEEYHVTEDGRALTGTVRVRFVRDGRDSGSYVLHRRFERLP